MIRIQLVLVASILLAGLSAQAEVSKEEFNDLKARYEELAEKIDADRRPAWTDRIKISGDFRYRYEKIDVDGGSDSNRSRIRARAVVKATLANNVEVGFGLATGSANPVSTNVTLGEGGSSKDIKLDLAYASWTGIDNTVLTAGKFKNPLVRAGGNGMLWDSDWRPEGLTAGWDNGQLFGTAIGGWLEGDSRKGTEFLWGLQGGWKGELNGATVKVGASYFDIPVKGANSLFGDVDDFFGNSFTCTDPLTPANCTYDLNYEEIELFAEAGIRMGNQPVRFFANYVKNQDADNNDTGWAAGFIVGKVNDRGQWEAGYLYQNLEADAALGLVADSDIGGGGTDLKGHKIKVAYGLSKMIALKLTYFINEIDLASGNPRDYDRLHLDIQFKYK